MFVTGVIRDIRFNKEIKKMINRKKDPNDVDNQSV